MGIVEAKDNEFRHEGASVVYHIGLEVQGLKAGARVMVIGSCLFKTRLILSENLWEKIPGGLSFNDAAGMPCVFSTPKYYIFDIGKLKRDRFVSP
ncbi:hypothetical protein N7517_011589 [Penicillium concentricum]|uniref:Uncharacterized protein n=1 Tax=Penicillium concentricum TaxID=293559 RepID=A0A9W9UVJ7_9EURO|nr:uncharacterized protein N7517_011589 [Penicillium concentricum]KAJ5356980.1 hypothetical protein N7517_011589 [Penicillium concentricum]